MAELGSFTVDLTVVGQPECCKALCEAGWLFRYDPDTQFVGAEHPLGGKSSVVQVYRIGRTSFDADEIGNAIAMLLNGGRGSADGIAESDSE